MANYSQNVLKIHNSQIYKIRGFDTSSEEYEGNTYTVVNYMFEDDTNIVEICFRTVDSDAEYKAVDEIINTLKKN